MVTFAQAQERAERWANGDVPAALRRAVRVREFGLGFVAWAEARGEGETPGEGEAWGAGAAGAAGEAAGPSGAGGEAGAEAGRGRARLVIARDGGDTSLWPGLAVEEVIRRYEEEYGRGAPVSEETSGETAGRVDLEATSFLLTPPEWLQEAADQRGTADRPGARASSGAGAGAGAGADSGVGSGSGSGSGSGAGSGAVPAGVSPWDAADTSGSGVGEAQTPPATVFAPPLSGSDDDDDDDGTWPPSAHSEVKTGLIPEGNALPNSRRTPEDSEDPESASASTSGSASGRGPGSASGSASGSGPGFSSGSGAGPGGDVHHAATVISVPGPQGAGYVPTMIPSQDPAARPTEGGQHSEASGGHADARVPGAGSPSGSGSGTSTGSPAGPVAGAGSGDDVHRAETLLSGPSQGTPAAPGPPPPPAAPGQGAGDDVHRAATLLSGPGQGPSRGGPAIPPPPGPPPAYGFPPGAPPPAVQGVPAAPGLPGAPPAYGYPQQPPGRPLGQPTGQPTVGPGYMAVLGYRAPDGSEQQLIRRSAPGLPHPEWQILHELRAMNVPPEQVVELHTELESCELPGGYCARMIRETWPQVRVTHTAPYGRDHVSRQQGMRHLIEHQGELHQVADGPARPAPSRVPLPPQQQIPPLPPIPLDGVGHELLQAYGPQGVFRFDQRAVSRQGVPDVVGQTLTWAGLPLQAPPFFWAQAQPDRPVPTLAELAQERGVRPGPDAGSYLVMGNDFGRQLCVQYGTAHIVAVPLEGAPDGQPARPQFANTGLPEFTRCLAMLGRMWPLRYGLTQEQAGRWTVDFQMQLAALDPAALSSPENWWSVLLEQMWDGLF